MQLMLSSPERIAAMLFSHGVLGCCVPRYTQPRDKVYAALWRARPRGNTDSIVARYRKKRLDREANYHGEWIVDVRGITRH